MLTNMAPPLGLGKKCPSKLAYKVDWSGEKGHCIHNKISKHCKTVVCHTLKGIFLCLFYDTALLVDTLLSFSISPVKYSNDLLSVLCFLAEQKASAAILLKKKDHFKD